MVVLWVCVYVCEAYLTPGNYWPLYCKNTVTRLFVSLFFYLVHVPRFSFGRHFDHIWWARSLSHRSNSAKKPTVLHVIAPVFFPLNSIQWNLTTESKQKKTPNKQFHQSINDRLVSLHNNMVSFMNVPTLKMLHANCQHGCNVEI